MQTLVPTYKPLQHPPFTNLLICVELRSCIVWTIILRKTHLAIFTQWNLSHSLSILIIRKLLKRTANLWNKLPAEYFPTQYNLHLLKSWWIFKFTTSYKLHSYFLVLRSDHITHSTTLYLRMRFRLSIHTKSLSSFYSQFLPIFLLISWCLVSVELSKTSYFNLSFYVHNSLRL